MLERQTVIDQIELGGDGEVRVRLGLCIFEDGVELVRKYHRTLFDPAGDEVGVDVQMAAVNAHLAAMGELPVPAAGIADIKAHFGLQKTRRALRG